MANGESIEQLRLLAGKRHRAAAAKVSRLKAKGVEIAGTKLDPRREPKNLKRYTRRQLETYINQLDKFVSRGTQYQPSAHKTEPLSGNLWHTYKSLESAVNRKNAQPYESIKDRFISSLGMTVDQFQGAKPSHPVTGNPASRAPHLPVNKSSKGIPNDRQLKKLIKDMQRKLNPEYSAKVNKRDRGAALKMLKTVGATDITKATRGMTAAQFSFMWNYTNFANIASFDYQIAKSKHQDPTSLAQFDAAFDTQLREMRKIIKDVKDLDL